MADENIEVQTPETPAPTPEVPMNERPVDGPGSGRGELRKQLEKSAEQARKADGTFDKRQPAKQPQRSRARQEAEAQEQEAAPAPAEGEQEAPVEGQTETKPPEGWTREAKAEWERLPPHVQAAVSKREEDMNKGVEQLKASHKDIDEALKPRLDTIRRFGHTPAQAVNQLFAWFEALGANPQAAFPALAQSFKFDLKTLPGMQATPPAAAPGTQPGAQPPAQPVAQPGSPAADIPPYVKTLEDRIAELQNTFGQQLNYLGQNFQQASQAKTEEILANWAKDKPYFEEVRQMMGHLISSNAVAPLANGSADLDKAYDMALYALPDVRNKVLADQQQKAEAARVAKAAAEKKAQQEQADKARKAAAGSLTQGAPGAPAAGQTAKKKGKSVRESIMEARQELSE